MESSATQSRTAAAAAASPLPMYPPALLSLPDLDRPPAIMEMWELEAVAAALPAKKRRLRETFDRLAACSPTPLPFRWDDLDAYISSLQYSVTLRRRQLRELDKPTPPAPPPPAPAPPAAVVTGGGDVSPAQALDENPRPAPVNVLPAAVSESVAKEGDVVPKFRALVNLKRIQPQHPAPAPPAAVSAPAATTAVHHVEEGRKRKVAVAAEEAHVTTTRTTQEAQAEIRPRKMKMIQGEDAAAVAKKTSPSPSHDSNGKELMPAPQGAAEPEANASTGATVKVEVDPVSKDAVLQRELPGPATPRHATNRARSAAAAGVPSSTSPQRGRRPPSSAAAVVVTGGRDPEKSKKRKVSSPKAEAAGQKLQMQQEHAVQEEDAHARHGSVVTAMNVSSHHDGGEQAKVSPRRPVPGTGGSGLPITTATAPVDADPICKTGGGGIRQESPADTNPLPPTTRHACNGGTSPLPREQRQQVVTTTVVVPPPDHEVPDVEMEIVHPEEEIIMPQVLDEEDAPSMVVADKVSPPLPLDCSSSGHAQADAGAGTATAMPPAAGAATVRNNSPPSLTPHSPNLVQASAPPGVPTATRHVSASHATRPAPPAAGSGSQQDASDVSPVPPRGGGNGGPARLSRVSAVAQTDRVRESTGVVRQGSMASGSRREHTGPSEASAHRPPNAGRHVLQQQHMPQQHERISSSSLKKEQQEWPSKNHGGRPTGSSRPVPEAQRSWSRPSEGRGGGTTVAARGLHGDDSSNRNTDSFKAKRPQLFCDNCGCKGHLAEKCRTAKHLVALYQKAKEDRERAQKQICYRCGCTGHWSRSCRTAKHLVDLYQKDRAAKRAAGLPQE